ncbi:MAG: RNase adapter RapZ [Alphaproteobacteria bacterium]|nr:MAG: RNase adapter RapZ [Alphaproteobacteria bacterium]
MTEASPSAVDPSTPPGAVAQPRLVMVTGMSGAGRSLALRTFEDLGFEAVDNLPLSLLAPLVRGDAAPQRSLAIGIDTRTRGFSIDVLLAERDLLRRAGPWAVTLLFLTSDDEVLLRRYTETRRRHPLAADRPVADGIAVERRLLEPLKAAADVVLDTTMSTPADLRRQLSQRVLGGQAADLAISVVSFAFRNGLPREADLVFDVRFLNNPHYDPVLRPRDGRDPEVAAYVAADPDFAAFWDHLTGLLAPLLPRYRAEGKSYLTIAVGCTGGRHRSVFLGERLHAWLAERGLQAALTHRDVDRPAVSHG